MRIRAPFCIPRGGSVDDDDDDNDIGCFIVKDDKDVSVRCKPVTVVQDIASDVIFQGWQMRL